MKKVLDDVVMDAKTFELVVEGGLMPLVSFLGVLGNLVSLAVLHHRDVKLRKDFVNVLSALAAFDILFLIAFFFTFSLPTWSDNYEKNYFKFVVSQLFVMGWVGGWVGCNMCQK